VADFDELYCELGRKIRSVRERKRLTQGELAKRLGISRASVVNIEAGRQHTPLHLLWKLAEMLGTELTSLIPSREEMLAPAKLVQLHQGTIQKIEDAFNGNPRVINVLTEIVGIMKVTTEAPPPDRKSHAQTKSRRKG
jgi:transcriptional regulator with XRE-family HTH domain